MDTRPLAYPEVGVVILGGGEATRLPGKLTLLVGELPMIVRVTRNFSSRREIVVAAKGTFSPAVDALLTVPIVVDRWARRGPLAGMSTTLLCMRSQFVFAVAGDAPLVDERLLVALAARRRPGDEAVVPAHGDDLLRLEPLATLYDRIAFLREAVPLLRDGRGALRETLARLRTQVVRVDDAATFANVNTAADYGALGQFADDADQPRF